MTDNRGRTRNLQQNQCRYDHLRNRHRPRHPESDAWPIHGAGPTSRAARWETEGQSIDTAFLRRCIRTLELAPEQSGKLLRKRLATLFAGNQQADRLAFKDLFRHAAHNYGEDFADATLRPLPVFAATVKALADAIEAADDG